MSNYLIRLTLLGFFALGAAMLTGCNTMEGAGKDIQRTGEAIEDAAD